jgi:stage III sporulation protein SpoIIIAA
LTARDIRITDDLELLLAVMPPPLRQAIASRGRLDELLEIVLDLGRPAEARFPGRVEDLSDEPVSRQDLHHVVDRVGRFAQDNRAGIERTLHRISAIRNRVGEVVGLTCRVGRAVYGTVDFARDVIEAGKSVLLLGRPGVGKTTLLREAARVLADELGKRVIVVDTSNEIAGDGDIPHPGIGRARRMQVASPEAQHAVMIEAVENHMPETVVIDEIGTSQEALAARTIAERGVQLIATAHGNTLENLLQNPTLSDLIGGIQPVILSDEEARRRGSQKTVLERRAPPTFGVVIEIQQKDTIAVHHDVAATVDRFLRGAAIDTEQRVRTADGELHIARAAGVGEPHVDPQRPRRPDDGRPELRPGVRPPEGRTLRLFPFAVSRSKLERAIRDLRVPVQITQHPEDADLILALKSHERRAPPKLREAQTRGVPLHVLKSNTIAQMENFLRSLFGLRSKVGGEEEALREVEEAAEAVVDEGRPWELQPRRQHLRRLQHAAATRMGMASESKGDEPYRRVVLYPPR